MKVDPFISALQRLPQILLQHQQQFKPQSYLLQDHLSEVLKEDNAKEHILSLNMQQVFPENDE